MTATNKCYNFVGFGYRAPLNMAESYHRLERNKPHRKFGVCSSRRLAIRGFGNGEVPFF